MNEPLPRRAGTEDEAARAAEDAALVARMAKGDQAAFGALYDRHASMLMAIGVRMLKSALDAEDLVHDVLLEAWRRSETFDPERGTVRVWLAMRMRSRALDRIRSKKRVSHVPLEQTDGSREERAVETSPDAAESLAVRGALEALSEDQRAVLMLGYFQGMSSSEISKSLGIPLGTVKSRVAAAMKKMRAALSEESVP